MSLDQVKSPDALAEIVEVGPSPGPRFRVVQIRRAPKRLGPRKDIGRLDQVKSLGRSSSVSAVAGVPW